MVCVAVLPGFAGPGGLVLLVIPGVIFEVWFMLAIPSKVLGNQPGRTALSKSKRLVQPVFMKAMLFGLALVLAAFLVPFAFQLVFVSIYGLMSTNPARILIPAVVNYLVMVFWSTVVSIGIKLLYIERMGGLKNPREDLFV